MERKNTKYINSITKLAYRLVNKIHAVHIDKSLGMKAARAAAERK